MCRSGIIIYQDISIFFFLDSPFGTSQSNPVCVNPLRDDSDFEFSDVSINV